jgi:hypothetical protein
MIDVKMCFMVVWVHTKMTVRSAVCGGFKAD